MGNFLNIWHKIVLIYDEKQWLERKAEIVVFITCRYLTVLHAVVLLTQFRLTLLHETLLLFIGGGLIRGFTVVVVILQDPAIRGAPSAKLVDVFLGVPYAKAPTGPLRFKVSRPSLEPTSLSLSLLALPTTLPNDLQKPQAPDSWTEERDALQFGEGCISTGPLPAFPGTSESEDCLFLNVFAPVDRVRYIP